MLTIMMMTAGEEELGEVILTFTIVSCVTHFLKMEKTSYFFLDYKKKTE